MLLARVLMMRVALVLTPLAILCAACSEPNLPCGRSEWPTNPVIRVAIVDSASGSSLMAVALAERIDIDGSPRVAVHDWIRLPDPTGTLGRGPMRVRISAEGYASREVSLPQSCLAVPELVPVPLRRLSQR